MMNGMLQGPPPAPQAPQGGMLDAQAPQPPGEGRGYTGVISVNGEKVQVTNGVLEDDGEVFYVSDDGRLVLDGERDVIGVIENGVVKELDDERIELLKSEGYLE